MSTNVPIGSCCSKPHLNSVGGIDDDAWLRKLPNYAVVQTLRRTDPIIFIASFLRHWLRRFR